ncbi:hypothetical protein SBOR_6780 [Sclerotinia borealis F-4128]|uniref:Uncharacterized protein n=1 Tax=Sclerotinia borealis (strain F-4128) TaxID=1432307 RepID=W9CAH0_SCLBF|nr:hypothetical protein SBOR_6780 [Sclerotinia borealis F-4128]
MQARSDALLQNHNPCPVHGLEIGSPEKLLLKPIYIFNIMPGLKEMSMLNSKGSICETEKTDEHELEASMDVEGGCEVAGIEGIPIEEHLVREGRSDEWMILRRVGKKHTDILHEFPDFDIDMGIEEAVAIFDDTFGVVMVVISISIS